MDAGARFVWDLWVVWLALFRLAQIAFMAMAFLAESGSQVGLSNFYVLDAPLFATSLACVPVSWSLWRRVPRTRRSSIWVAQAASFLILFFGSLLLVPGAYLAFAVFGVSWFTLNAAGFAKMPLETAT